MKVGVGFSRERDPELALSEAYRKSLQKAGATRADLCLIFYSYDYALDAPIFSAALKKILRDIPSLGSSTWSAWSSQESIESETGLMVVSLSRLEFEYRFFKVHSLREKAELWSAEVARQLNDMQLEDLTTVFFAADSLNFTPGSGLSFLERHFPKTQFVGYGASYTIPQCSIILNSEVFLNAMAGIAISKAPIWTGLMQSICPELNEVNINRMSENLVIEIDDKPAFYRLSEHLMDQDDLPMMSPDEFRKHMGQLYVVEKPKENKVYPRVIGDPYRVISLLGSEMTTGMVAVGQALDFSQRHFLAQKKVSYMNDGAEKVLAELHEMNAKPSAGLMIVNSSRLREKNRDTSDMLIWKKYFPDTPLIGISSQSEFLGQPNSYSGLLIVLP